MEIGESMKSFGNFFVGYKDKAIADTAALNCVGFIVIFAASCLFPFLAIFELYWVLGLMYGVGASIMVVGIIVGGRRAAALEKAIKERRAQEAIREAKRVASGV